MIPNIKNRNLYIAGLLIIAALFIGTALGAGFGLESQGNISIVYPQTNINVTYQRFFNLSVNVTCGIEDCGKINVTLDPDSWWNESWKKQKELTIASVASSNISDFPAHLRITKESTMKSDLSDLRFISGACDDIEGSILDYEIESSNSTNAEIWIKITSLQIGNTSICMYYNNSNSVAGENTNAVWNNNYVAVHHLEEISGTHEDSTSNNNDGTNSGTTQNANGIVGIGNDMPGTGYIRMGTFSDLASSNAVSIEYWAKQDTVSQNQYGLWANGNILIQHGDTYNIAGSTNLRVRWNLGGTWRNSHTATGVLDTTGWHYWVFDFNAGSTTIYKDGVSVYTGTDTQTTFSSTTPDYDIGLRAGQGGLDGLLDEFRISNVSRNSDWVNQTYQLIKNQDLYVFENEEETYSPTKGIISTILGTTPFYTNSSNPRTINLNASQSEVVTFWVNATGDIGSTWEFFAYANQTSNMSQNHISNKFNVTIVEDTGKPIISVYSPENKTYGSNIVLINFSADDYNLDSLFYYNGSENITYSGPVNITLLEGGHSLILYANDSVGNIDYIVVNLTIDTTGPEFQNLANVNIFNQEELNYQIDATDISGVDCFTINDTVNFNIDCSGNLINATNLSVGLYYINITVNDTIGNIKTTKFFINATATPDSNAPIIINVISGNITNQSANIFWDTNELSNSSINYGLTKTLGNIIDSELLVTSHYLKIVDLHDNTIIFYNVTSCDISMNCNTSGPYNFTTTKNNSVIEISQVSPTDDINVTQNNFFNFSINVTCKFADCQNVNVSLDPILWWNNQWLKRKEINISNLGSSTLNNYPSFINITIEDDMENDLSDLRFLNGSCASLDTLELDFEIESYTISEALIWLKIPQLTVGTNSICMYYSNTNADSNENKESVWDDNYMLVMHMDNLLDSTKYSNDGTLQGQASLTGEFISDASRYDGTNDWIEFSDSNTLDGMTQLTIESWVKSTTSDGNPRGLISKRTTSSSEYSYSLFYYTGSSLYFDTANGGTERKTSTFNLPANEWHYVVASFDGTADSTSRKRFYYDGALDSVHSSTITSIPDTPSAFRIGILNADYGNAWFGDIDEVRISNITRSKDWINQTYSSINNYDSIVSIGESETFVKGLVSTVIGDTPLYTIDNNPIIVNLSKNEVITINWQINATGNTNTTWELFTYAHLLNNTKTNITSQTINVTIVAPIPTPTSITISDTSDNATWYENSYGKFYINYTYNYTVISDAKCNITLPQNPRGAITNLLNLTYNTTSQLYETGTIFETPGTYEFNATCSKAGYDTVLESSHFTLSSLSAPQFILKRYVYDISECTTLSCNKTGGILVGTYVDGEQITLNNTKLYRMTIETEQVSNSKNWAIDPSIGLPTREVGLPE